MKKNFLLLCFLLCATSMAVAQKRYLEKTFDQVSVSSGIYGYNYTVLLVPQTGHSRLQPLVYDLYQPTGDTETARPLILYFHTGNFLPFPQNGGPSGTRSDSTIVEMCTRLAKMGYVVASCDYRLGWNPLAPKIEDRINTLINAAYRGVQDARTAIRYFKLEAESISLDTSKIILFGQGTGGYVTLNTATLDKYSEIPNTTSPPGKFINPDNGFPYVLESFNGNIDGTSWGILNFPGHPQDGDTLNRPNNLGPSSDFQLQVNIGGALGDISWLDENTPPMISFQSPTDPFAPYNTGVLIVPQVNLPVVEVQGALAIQQKVDELGLNAAFADKDFQDPLSNFQESLTGYSGLYPLNRPDSLKYDSSPWDFWAASNPNNAAGLQTNPNMSKEKAIAFMDTIINFMAPRACLVLNLGCDLTGYLNIKKINVAESGVEFYPNPASNLVNIQSPNKEIKGIVVFDAAGRAVKTFGNINSRTYTLNRGDLPVGVYYAQLRFEKEVTTIRISFQGK